MSSQRKDRTPPSEAARLLKKLEGYVGALTGNESPVARGWDVHVAPPQYAEVIECGLRDYLEKETLRLQAAHADQYIEHLWGSRDAFDQACVASVRIFPLLDRLEMDAMLDREGTGNGNATRTTAEALKPHREALRAVEAHFKKAQAAWHGMAQNLAEEGEASAYLEKVNATMAILVAPLAGTDPKPLDSETVLRIFGETGKQCAARAKVIGGIGRALDRIIDTAEKAVAALGKGQAPPTHEV
jgi:hypothetical protein